MATSPKYLTRTGMQRALADIEARLDAEATALLDAHPIETPNDFLDFEKAACELGAAVADRLIQRAIYAAHLDADLRKKAAAAVRERYRTEGEPQRIDNRGPNPVCVRLPGGTRTHLRTPYLRPNRKGLPGRPRTKRHQGGAGRYPVLEWLGIQDGVTPLTRSRISRQLVQCDSYNEAQDQLRADGLRLDISTIVNVAVATGDQALTLRNQALEAARTAPLPEVGRLAGLRVRVSLDGGRIRTRQTHHTHRKQKNGRRAFDLEWREPRVITLDLLDEEGKPVKGQRPIYETELDNAEAVFQTLEGLLRLLGVHQAEQLVFVADGADWIWARVDALLTAVGIPPERVVKVLDFYHATEAISKALKACKNLSTAERKARFERLRRLLLEPSGAQQVIDELSSLARGRRAKAINKKIKYLENHLCHMNYAELRARKVPLGSGVVESAIRRVVNLRFKAASKCWCEEHLPALLYLRAILKAGRWDDVMASLLARRHWLSPAEALPEPIEETA